MLSVLYDLINDGEATIWLPKIDLEAELTDQIVEQKREEAAASCFMGEVIPVTSHLAD